VERCRYNPATVSRALSKLEHLGWLERSRQGRAPNAYRVLCPALPDVTDPVTSNDRSGHFDVTDPVTSKPLDVTDPVTSKAIQTSVRCDRSGHFDVTDPVTCSKEEQTKNRPRRGERRAQATRPAPRETKPDEKTQAREPAAHTPSNRGTRFDLATLPDDWRDWCASARPDLDPGETFADFADYWRAKPGKEGLKLDWLATWRRWVRNQHARPAAGSQRSGGPTMRRADGYVLTDAEIARQARPGETWDQVRVRLLRARP